MRIAKETRTGRETKGSEATRNLDDATMFRIGDEMCVYVGMYLVRITHDDLRRIAQGFGIADL